MAATTLVAMLAWMVLAPGAQAAMSIESGPRVAVSAHQVTIWWHSSSSGSSELRWDTANKGDFASFANDVSNTSSDLGTVHSRTISHLPAGEYWFRTRTTGAAGTATSAAQRFVVSVAQAGTPLGATVVDGGVNDVAASSSRIYLGGNFTAVGTRRGSTIELSSSTAALTSAGQPQFAGSTRANAADGTGGWYVGGCFTHVGGLPRQGLARLLPDGGVDPYFAASGALDTGCVSDLAVTASRLYVLGGFTAHGSTSRPGLAALDPTTGALDVGFDPGTGADGSIDEIDATASRLYVAGWFSTFDGVARSNVAALDLATGDVDPAFDPGTGLNNDVLTMDATATHVYLGGYFTTVDGVARNRLAALDATTGALDTTFAVGTGANSRVEEVLQVGTRLYVGGAFTTYAGATRNYLMAVDPSTAAVDTTFNPGTGPNSVVAAFAHDGTNLYIGGDFSTYGASGRAGIASLNPTTAALGALNPGTGFTETVTALGVDGGRLLASGDFTTYQPTARNRLAALDASTGALDTGFNPGSGANSQVDVLTLAGAKLYIGGYFTTYNGSTRRRLAAVDAATGALDTTFNPGTGPSSNVAAIDVEGTRVYIGGNFSTYAGTSRTYLAAVSATTAALDTTFVPPAINGTVSAIDATATRVFLGGSFTTYGGTGRSYVASVDAATAALDSTFNPGTGADSTVNAILASGTRVYLGGMFTALDGTPRGRVGALDATTGALDTGFAAGTGASSWVYDLDMEGSRLYLSGTFGSYDGVTRTGAAAVDATTGTLDTDVELTSGGGTITSIEVTGTRAVLGGFLPFDRHRGVSASGFLLLGTPVNDGVDGGSLVLSGAPQQSVAPYQTTVWWTTSASSSSELAWDTRSHASWRDYPHTASNTSTNLGTRHSRTISNLPAGTYYYRVRSRTAAGEQVTSTEYSFTVSTPDASTPLGSTVVDGTVNALAQSGDRLYLGGSFTRVGRRLGGGIQLDPTTAALRSSAGLPQLSGALRVTIPDGSGGWYVGGSFTRVGGLERHYVAHLLPDGGVDPAFDAGVGPNRFVGAMALSGGKLYIGGFFTSVNGTSRNYIAALDATTGALDTTFDPGTGFDDQARALQVNGGRLYVGGSFTSYQGQPHSGLIALDPTTAAVDATFDAGVGTGGASPSVWTIAISGGKLYLGGFFLSYDGVPRSRIAAVALSTGQLDTTFDPGTGFDTGVREIAIIGSRLYAAGNFTAYAGVGRNRVAALSTTDAALDTTFDPGTGFNNITNGLSTDGTKIYVAGSFTSYGGAPRSRIAALHPTTAALDATFDPGSGFEQQLLTVHASGGVVFTGGTSATYRGVTRNRLAALDRVTGELDAGFDPGTGPDTDVLALAADATRLYVGGSFTSYGGTGRNRIAGVSLTSGSLDGGFNPGSGADAPVRALLVDGTRLYLGGDFTSYAGTGRNRIAAVTASSGALDTGFNPGSGADGVVHALTLQGTRLYLGGAFGTVAGSARTRLAAVHATSGVLDSGFNPGAGPDNTVHALASNASQVYLGGAFSSYAGATRSKVAAVHPATAAVDPTFDSSGTTSGEVRALALSGSLLAVGGTFNTLQSAARFRIGMLDATTAVPDPVRTFGIGAVESAGATVVTSLLASGSRLTAGGEFAVMNDVSQGRLAMFDVCDRSTFCGDELLRDYVSINIPTPTIALPDATAGLSSTATLAVQVQSNSFNGYTLAATDDSDVDSLACTAGACAGTAIPDWAGGAPSPWPEAGSSYGFGVTVLGSTHHPKDEATWGSGATATDFVQNRYVGLAASTSTTLHAPDRHESTAVDTTTLGLRARVSHLQAPGAYSGTIAITAIANP